MQDITLEETTWVLTRMPSRSIRVPERPPTLALDPSQGRASGFAGCNEFSARYRLAGRQLTFRRVTYTRKRCPEPDAMKIEDAFLAALPQVRSWRIDKSTLSLRNSAGRSVLTFERMREGDRGDGRHRSH